VDARVHVTSAEGVMACVKAGLGIAVVALWLCRAELERGEVRAGLSDYVLEPVDAHAGYPAGPHPVPKVRAVSDYLAAKLGQTSVKVTGEGGRFRWPLV